MDWNKIYHTVLTYGSLAWSEMVGIPILVVGTIGGKDGPEKGRRLIRWWSGQFIKATGMTYEVFGLENIRPERNYLVMSSHRSHIDGPLLNVTTPFTFSFVIKKSLGDIPIWGWAVKSAGYVPIMRENKKKAKQELKGAAQHLSQGNNMLVFPEGTRSPTDEFLPFKKGGIVLAIQAQVPILPVAISGTGHILPKNATTMSPGHAIIRYGKPIETGGLTYEDRNDLLKRVEKAIKALYIPGPVKPGDYKPS